MADAQLKKEYYPDNPDELEPSDMLEKAKEMIRSLDFVWIKRGGEWQEATLGRLHPDELTIQVIWPHDKKPGRFQHKSVDVVDLLKWQKEAEEQIGSEAKIIGLVKGTSDQVSEVVSGGRDEDDSGE